MIVKEFAAFARIADRTVIDAYFVVGKKVEALYDADPVLAAYGRGEAGHAPAIGRNHAPCARRWLLRAPTRVGVRVPRGL